jgi:hypothetical protein
MVRILAKMFCKVLSRKPDFVVVSAADSAVWYLRARNSLVRGKCVMVTAALDLPSDGKGRILHPEPFRGQDFAYGKSDVANLLGSPFWQPASVQPAPGADLFHPISQDRLDREIASLFSSRQEMHLRTATATGALKDVRTGCSQILDPGSPIPQGFFLN